MLRTTKDNQNNQNMAEIVSVSQYLFLPTKDRDRRGQPSIHLMRKDLIHHIPNYIINQKWS
jgi:hypothetical protein